MGEPTTTSLDSGGTGTDLSSYPTASKTFEAGTLYILHAAGTIGSGTPAAPTSVTFTADTSPWTIVPSASVGVSGKRLDAYVIIPAAQVGPDTVTVSYGAQAMTGFDYVIEKISLSDVSGTALASILQSAATSGTSATPSVALTNPPAAASLTVGCIANPNTAITAGTNFAEVIQTGGHASPSSRMEVEKDNGTPRQTADWTMASGGFVAHILEVKRAATDSGAIAFAMGSKSNNASTVARSGTLGPKIGTKLSAAGRRGRGFQFSPVYLGPAATEGGGAINVALVNPSDTTNWFVGGDDSMVNKTSDGGLSYSPRDAGMSGRVQVGALALDPDNPNNMYLGYGTGTELTAAGGFYYSADGGAHWKFMSSAVMCCGNGTITAELGGGGVRSVGTLIQVVSGRVFIGDYTRGMAYSDNNGANWTYYALVPGGGITYLIRGILQDPTTPDTFWVGVYDDGAAHGGLYKVAVDGTTTKATLPAGFVTVEELWYSSGTGNMYAACGLKKVAVSTDGGTTWNAAAGNSSLSGTSKWATISGRYDAGSGKDILFVGCAVPTRVGVTAFYDCISRSADSGATFASVTDGVGGTPVNTILGTGATWWVASSGTGGNSTFLLGKANYTCHQLTVSGTRIISCGKSGVWVSTDDGVTWNPSVHDLDVTTNQRVVINPVSTQRGMATDSDWQLQAYDLHGQLCVTNVSGVSNNGMMAYDETGAGYYAGANGSGARVMSNSAPHDAGSWVDLNQSSLNLGLIGTPIAWGLGVTKDGSGNRIVLTPIIGVGMFRYTSATTLWTAVAPGYFTQATPPGGGSAAFFAPQDGRNLALFGANCFAFDPAHGVLRSQDYGVTWGLMWAITSTNNRYTMKVDAVGQKAYVLVGQKLYRADNVFSISPIIPDVSAPLRSDVDAVGLTESGTVLISTHPNSTTGTPGAMMNSVNYGANWNDESNTVTQNSSADVWDMTGADDGTRWWVQNSAGVNVNGGFNPGTTIATDMEVVGSVGHSSGSAGSVGMASGFDMRVQGDITGNFVSFGIGTRFTPQGAQGKGVRVTEYGNEFLSATPDDEFAVLGLDIPTNTASEIEASLTVFQAQGDDGSVTPVNYTAAGVKTTSRLSFVLKYDADTSSFLDSDKSFYAVGADVIVGTADDTDVDTLIFGVFV